VSDDPTITRNTRVTIGSVATLGAGLVGMFMMLHNRLRAFEEPLDEVSENLRNIQYSLREIRDDIKTLDVQAAGLLTRTEFNAWVQVLDKNPELNIPNK
jgi:hypothetical protein